MLSLLRAKTKHKMKEVIEILLSKIDDLQQKQDIISKANRIVPTESNANKNLELTILIEKIEEGIGYLKCHKEIKILEALIQDGRIKDPND